ncbi:hypothetical protein TcarDRAFT_1285 [Thermosinus carboxydivorans Nor1]|uniref:Uncharacterized protein n=1 Tax=Thermosinus carboxydivorans Nor1 TaxID=401526 RepID=A1HR52_9FIRM|nr:hypothetical protein [Thermosinus carboxydivorans]EAX47550.1 hypothetical protein TcarDRAFT_1285 [Thermosinus carboxydivorans Nor1]
MSEVKNAAGASVPMETVEGIDQDIIKEVLADEGVKLETETAKSEPKQQEQKTAQQDDDWPEDDEKPVQQQTGKPPKGYVPLQALHEEREARKMLQQQMMMLQQQLMQMQEKVAQPAKQQQEEDPLAALVRQQLESALPQYLKPVSEVQQLIKQMQEEQAIRQRVIQSEANARAKYPDYDEVVEPVRQRVMSDPDFAKLILQMPDPAEFAYLFALGQQAQAQRLQQGKAKVQKLEQAAAMPRSMQIKGGAGPAEYESIDDLIENFDKLTPAQQQKLLKLTNKIAGG